MPDMTSGGGDGRSPGLLALTIRRIITLEDAAARDEPRCRMLERYKGEQTGPTPRTGGGGTFGGGGDHPPGGGRRHTGGRYLRSRGTAFGCLRRRASPARRLLAPRPPSDRGR